MEHTLLALSPGQSQLLNAKQELEALVDDVRLTTSRRNECGQYTWLTVLPQTCILKDDTYFTAI